MDTIAPLFGVGDFVACDYSQIVMFSYYDDEGDTLLYYGIVVAVDYAYYDYMDEYFYEVLFLDGIKRYFMETELRKI